MATQFRLNPRQIHELEVIRDLPPERLAEVCAALNRVVPPPLTTNELGSILGEVLGADSEVSEILLKQVVSLASLERHQDLAAGDVLRGLLYGIRASAPSWTQDDFERWQTVEPELRRILEHPSVWRVSKALDLSYDFAYLLQEARVVSDIRPVFDREATEIEAAVVSFTLRLRYDGVNGEHGVSVAMNESDVKDLLQECQRALRKAHLASEVMNGKARIRTIISGQGDAGGENDVDR